MASLPEALTPQRSHSVGLAPHKQCAECLTALSSVRRSTGSARFVRSLLSPCCSHTLLTAAISNRVFIAQIRAQHSLVRQKCSHRVIHASCTRRRRCRSPVVSSPHLRTPSGSGVHRNCSHRFTHESLTLLVIHTPRFGSPPQVFTPHGTVDAVLRKLCSRDLRAHLAVTPFLNSHSAVRQSTGRAFPAVASNPR